MTQRKARLTVTVDRDLIEAGNQAVAEGRAESISGWVNSALIDRTARDRRLAALALAIADYEAESGEITDQEMLDLRYADRAAAIVSRAQGRRAAPADQRSRRPKRATG
jgi:hypothetical protein